MATGDITWKWGSAGQELTWPSGGPASLGAGSFTSLSDELDISAIASGAVDILVSCRINPNSAPNTGAYVLLWAAAPADGVSYPADTENYVRVGVPVQVPAQAVTRSAQFSLAEAFGGVLPAKVKLALENRTGAALTATADDNEVYYQAVYAHVAG